jgi:hypothetical protein
MAKKLLSFRNFHLKKKVQWVQVNFCRYNGGGVLALGLNTVEGVRDA